VERCTSVCPLRQPQLRPIKPLNFCCHSLAPSLDESICQGKSRRFLGAVKSIDLDNSRKRSGLPWCTSARCRTRAVYLRRVEVEHTGRSDQLWLHHGCAPDIWTLAEEQCEVAAPVRSLLVVATIGSTCLEMCNSQAGTLANSGPKPSATVRWAITASRSRG
jgi:hypothetical protein